MRDMDICGSTGAPCIHCNPGPCEHRRRMCDGCFYLKKLPTGNREIVNACCFCASGHGMTRRTETGVCANYATARIVANRRAILVALQRRQRAKKIKAERGGGK